MTEVVHYAADRAIATVTLDSPTNRNALSAQLVGELSDRLAAASADTSVRAVVLSHTGSVFCAGAECSLGRRAERRSWRLVRSKKS